MAFPSYVNDPIYGMIHIPDYAMDIVSTPLFLRLQHVKQLGTLSTVWPSATHTRLVHSLGAMHLAMTYAAHLKLPRLDTMAFVIASLLHDIGHGPYSHTFERMLDQHPALLSKFICHDNYRFLLIQDDPQLRAAIERTDCTMVARVMDVWSGKNKLLHTLLAGTAGVDRLDYIMRDSYHLCPQRCLHQTNIQTIINHTYLATTVYGDTDSVMVKRLGAGDDITNAYPMYEDKAVKAICIFLETRDYMYSEVYFHHRAVASETMLMDAMMQAMALPTSPVRDWLDSSLSDPAQYVHVTDGALLTMLTMHHGDLPALKLFLTQSSAVKATVVKDEAEKKEDPNARVVVRQVSGLCDDECGPMLYHQLCDMYIKTHPLRKQFIITVSWE
jgi:HD superfamily phosphohydrolase